MRGAFHFPAAAGKPTTIEQASQAVMAHRIFCEAGCDQETQCRVRLPYPLNGEKVAKGRMRSGWAVGIRLHRLHDLSVSDESTLAPAPTPSRGEGEYPREPAFPPHCLPPDSAHHGAANWPRACRE